MANRSVLIRVPGTVGGFGGAVNCAALALEAALNVKATPRLDGRVGIRYFGQDGERVPRDRSNLIVRAMEAALHLRNLEFTGADFEIYSSVPVGIGLGSSSAAVLAGLIAADRLFRLELDEKALFDLAAIFESRGDNLGAACLGGLVTCTQGQSHIYRKTLVPADLVLDVIVPVVSSTAAAEAASSQSVNQGIPEEDHLARFQRAAALACLLGRHSSDDSVELNSTIPPNSPKSLPGLKEALQVQTPGLLSVFVCGSGPAVGILAEADGAAAVAAVQESFARHGVSSSAARFRASNSGAGEWNAVHADILPPPARALRASLETSTLIPV